MMSNTTTHKRQHVYIYAKAVLVEPATSTKTADYKELQMCRDGHEDFRGVGHLGEVHITF